MKDHWNRAGVVHDFEEFRWYLISYFEELFHLVLHCLAKTLELGYVPVQRPTVEVHSLVP